MNRRTFLQLAGAGAAALALPQWNLSARAADVAKKDRPNVLFIAIDDLNDWIGCMGGHPDTRTPNLDRLAARGTLFTNAHCAAPLCNPSRAALMTGIRPSTSGVYMNSNPWRKAPALAQAMTLPQHFMAHGYKAIGSGKIFHGAYEDPASWDDYWPSKKKCVPPSAQPAKRPLNGYSSPSDHFDWGPMDATDEEMGDYKVVSWGLEQLAAKHDKPLFLACGFTKPHLPWYVPRKYFDQFPLEGVHLPEVKADDLDDVPAVGRKIAGVREHEGVVAHDQWKQAVRSYLATIAFVDGQIGRLLDGFEKSPMASDTIVCLWSDHGWHLGEKLHWRKFTLWEEATRNILTIAAPGVTKPGGRCTRPVSHMDIYPTLTDLCGLPVRDGLEGTSLVPLLKDPAAPWDRPALTTYGCDRHTVRSERWRYIRYNDGTEELYDHAKDPNEWTNLAADAQCGDVKKDLARWLPKVNTPEIESDSGGGGGGKGKKAGKKAKA